MAVVSASAGLFIALCISAWNFFEGEVILQTALVFLTLQTKVVDITTVVYVGAVVFLALLAPALFGGYLIVESSSPRSYMGYLWRGGLLMVIALAVQELAERL